MTLYAKTVACTENRLEISGLEVTLSTAQAERILDAVNKLCQERGISVTKLIDPRHLLFKPTGRGRTPTEEDFLAIQGVTNILDISQKKSKGGSKRPGGRTQQSRIPR
jgi:hypothetical protein